MASEIRVDKINSLSGVGTVTLSPTGVDIAGITTAATLRATTGIVTSLTAGSLTSLGAVSGTTGTFSAAVSGTTGTFTGDVDIADKIVHTGDTDTAIRFPSADTFTVETGGSERLRIRSDGNVGIGTVSPTDPFHVYHASDNFIGRFESGDAGGGIILKDPTHSTSLITNDGDFTINVDNGSDVTGETIRFEMSGSEKLRIASTGDVLINKQTAVDVASTATAKLQVHHGSGNISAAFYSTADALGPGGVLALGHARATDTGVLQDNDVLGQIRFAGADGTDISTQGALITAEVNGTPSSNNMPTDLIFYTNNGSSSVGERVRLLKSGKFNIGGDFSQSTRQLSVVSSVEQVATFEYSGADADGSEVRFYHNSSSPADNDTLAFLQFSGKNSAAEVTMYSSISAQSVDVTNGTEDGNIIFSTRAAGTFAERVRIASDGKVGIGSDDPQAKLDVFATGGTIAQFGDPRSASFECIRIKNNVAGYPAISNDSTSDTLDLRSMGLFKQR